MNTYLIIGIMLTSIVVGAFSVIIAVQILSNFVKLAIKKLKNRRKSREIESEKYTMDYKVISYDDHQKFKEEIVYVDSSSYSLSQRKQPNFIKENEDDEYDSGIFCDKLLKKLCI